MIKRFLALTFFFLPFCFFSQNNNYESILNVVKKEFSTIDFQDKLLVISIWDSKDQLSREMNKEMYRTYTVYKDAKLKGGLKGVVFISISCDKNEIQFNIAENKDLNKYQFSICDFKGFDDEGKLAIMGFKKTKTNVVFDSNGNQLYYDLETQNIFKTFNNLITR